MTATGPATEYGMRLTPQHQALLAASAIDPEVAAERGYVTVTEKARLEKVGFSKAQRRVPGLLIPVHGVDGHIVSHEYRPDVPRVTDTGRVIKYEKPAGAVNVLNVHPRINGQLRDPNVELWVTEGARKVDAALSAGLCCIGLAGVYGWRGTDKTTGGKVALADWESVALNNRAVVLAFDCDMQTNKNVRTALDRLRGFLERRGAHVRLCALPDLGDGRSGLDDHLAVHTVEELRALVVNTLPSENETPRVKVESPPVAPCTLAETVATFRKHLWLPDPIPLYAVLAVAASNEFDTDPVWLLVVGGSGRGKTELVQAASGLPYARLTSKISGEAALLSGTNRRERARDATGGILSEIGERGLLILKDFTTILELKHDTRAQLLAALREIYDGKWSRDVGAEGGRKLEWSGRLGFIGGVTTAIDRAHAVMSIMGERFALVRVPIDDTHEDELATYALDQEDEIEMRRALVGAVSGLFAGPRFPVSPITPDDKKRIIALGRFTTTSRSPTTRDYRGELEHVGDREGPTRFLKQLRTILQGLDTLGIDRTVGWQVVARIAHDSIPHARRHVLDVLAQLDEERPETPLIGGLTGLPSVTTRRALEELAAHRVVTRHSNSGHPDRWELQGWARAAIALVSENSPSTRGVGTPDQRVPASSKEEIGVDGDLSEKRGEIDDHVTRYMDGLP